MMKCYGCFVVIYKATPLELCWQKEDKTETALYGQAVSRSLKREDGGYPTLSVDTKFILTAMS
jgi:hypothetical protein